jgi:hypothetical protein
MTPRTLPILPQDLPKPAIFSRVRPTHARLPRSPGGEYFCAARLNAARSFSRYSVNAAPVQLRRPDVRPTSGRRFSIEQRATRPERLLPACLPAKQNFPAAVARAGYIPESRHIESQRLDHSGDGVKRLGLALLNTGTITYDGSELQFGADAATPGLPLYTGLFKRSARAT